MIEPVTAQSAPDSEQARLREAGAAFESLILGQMLQGLMPEANAMSGAATQALAQQLAAESPFGIAKLLEARGR
jgi:hypothetical protein